MKRLKRSMGEERGSVLLMAQFVTLILILLAMGGLMTTLLNMRAEGNTRGGTVAFYIAEAGLERAKAELKRTSFNLTLAGADGDKDTTDDNGILSFGRSVPYHRGTYGVQVVDNDDGDGDPWMDSDQQVVIESTGSAGDGSRRTLKALVQKARLGTVNAALTIIDTQDRLELLSNAAAIGGDDLTYDPDRPNQPANGTSPAVHGMASSATTHTYIYEPNAAQNGITGVGNPPPDITSSISPLTLADVQATRQSLVDMAQVRYSGYTAMSGATLGTRQDPQIIHANDVLELSGNSSGAGILIVDKTLKVTGNLTWEGIILIGICPTCPGRLEITQGSSHLFGAVILANPSDVNGGETQVLLSGTAKIYYSTSAINLALQLTFKQKSWFEG